MSILENIGLWGYRYRHTRKDARGLYLHPTQVGDVTARVGPQVWIECKRDRNMWHAMVHQPNDATMFDRVLFMGVEISEDPKIPKNQVVFAVLGKEVGRISLAELANVTKPEPANSLQTGNPQDS